METLQLGGEISRALLLRRPALVERSDTNRVSCSDGTVKLLVVQDEREHAVQVFRRIQAVLQVQGNDDFAIRGCLEVVGGLQALSD